MNMAMAVLAHTQYSFQYTGPAEEHVHTDFRHSDE